MTDYRIEDIPGGELTAIAADDKLVILDADDTTDDTDGTTKYVELASLGLLATGSSKTSSFTAEVGVLHPVNVTTAQIIVTFPSAVAGDTFGYFVQVESTTAGDFAQAPGKAVEPATGSIINNVSYTQLSSGSNKWGLWMESECLIFRYYDATVGWQVMHDGRIPFIGVATDADAYDVTNATATAGVLGYAPDTDVGNMFDSTNDYFDTKRSNNYLLRCAARHNSAESVQRIQARMSAVSVTAAELGFAESDSAVVGQYTVANTTLIKPLTAGNFVALSVYTDAGNPSPQAVSRRELGLMEIL